VGDPGPLLATIPASGSAARRFGPENWPPGGVSERLGLFRNVPRHLCYTGGMESEIHGWHFHTGKLRDGRPLPAVGEKLIHDGPVVPCESGLHASPTPLQALEWAPGPFVDRVVLTGTVVPHGNPVDKYAASERTMLWRIDATDALRHFACLCALDVLPENAPEIVRRYLTTRDESIRLAAWGAAYAARDTAWGAAWGAARDTAWYTAHGAARKSSRARQDRRLTRMLNDAHRSQA